MLILMKSPLQLVNKGPTKGLGSSGKKNPASKAVVYLLCQ